MRDSQMVPREKVLTVQGQGSEAITQLYVGFHEVAEQNQKTWNMDMGPTNTCNDEIDASNEDQSFEHPRESDDKILHKDADKVISETLISTKSPNTVVSETLISTKASQIFS